MAPLIRARLPLIVDRVGTISTPGKDVDLLVTQYGLACNPEKTELDYRLRSAGLPVFTIEELHERAVGITGVPGRHPSQGRPVARVVSRDGDLLDIIRSVNR